MLRLSLTAAGIVFVAASPVLAQAPDAAIVSVTSVKATPAALAPGGRGVLTVTLAVAPGYHINAHTPNDPDLIPTAFTGAPGGVLFGAARYPAAKTVTVSYESKPMRVYTGLASIQVPFTLPKAAKRGHRVVVGGTLSYQGCNTSSCYPPASLPLRATVGVK